MRLTDFKFAPSSAWSLGVSLFAASAVSVSAQTRLSLPAGTVIIVQTTSALQSNTAQTGQTFERNLSTSLRHRMD